MRIFLRRLVAIAVLSLTTSTLDAQETQKEPVYRAGNGVTLPVVIHEERPQYTSEAMRAKITGSVIVEVTVTAKGETVDAEVTRSLDKSYGLDEACLKAAKQWKFKPGTKDGKPVAVRVWIEMTFTLK
jgi:periplasmic protein TonB